MGSNLTMKLLNSWGRHPGPAQHSTPIFWEKELVTASKKILDEQQTTLPFGNGRSYGDSCLASSNKVLHMRQLKNFVSADWELGVISAQAGVTLDEILRLCVPKGWFLPVTPGTKFITLGGALANDVHGKNHHVKGTFGCHVLDFDLHRSDRGTLTVSPDNDPELFAGTIGGLGLTGVITRISLKLIRINSSYIDVTSERFSNLSEFISLSDELDPTHDYAVAWVDCLAKGANLGRGIYDAGNHSQVGNLDTLNSKKKSVPITPPVSMINALTVKVFNSFYYNKAFPERKNSIQHFDPFFYPLDGINNWNRLYGARGFQQYQCVIPTPNAEDGISEILKRIAHHKHGSFLAVIKRCGGQRSPGLLSFPLEGISLALDFANNARSKQLFKELDAIVDEACGRLYPAKDAQMSASLFQKGYPQWQTVEKLRDPTLLSKFWKRVTQ